MQSGRTSSVPIAWLVLRAAMILLVSGLAGATLIRMAPGFGVDERVLDPRFSARSLEAMAREHVTERNPLAYYVRYLTGLLHGDAGRSVVFGQPVAALIRERIPATLRSVLLGLALGWGAAILFAVAGAASGKAAAALSGLAISGILLSVPSAVVAMVCLLVELPPAFAVAAVVFPRVFPHAYEQLRASQTRPHVLMARGRGLSATRVFFFHVVPPALMPVLALAGVSAILAFSASIPIEALADYPGIGQLAWRAALGRDLPTVVSITLLLTAVTVVGNTVADIIAARLQRRTA